MAVTLDTLAVSGASDVAIDRINNRIYVAQRGFAIRVFDLVTRQIIDSYQLPSIPRAVSLSPDGDFLAVTSDRSSIFRIDLASRVVRELATTADYQDIEVIDGDHALVSSSGGVLSRLEFSTGTVARVGLNDGGAALLVSSRAANSVLAISPQANENVQYYSFGNGRFVASGLPLEGVSGAATGVAVAGIARDIVFVTPTMANQYSRRTFAGALTIPQRVDAIAFDAPGTDILVRDATTGTIYRYALFGDGPIESNSRGTYVTAPATGVPNGTLGYGNQLLLGQGDRFIVSSDTNSYGAVQLVDTKYELPVGTGAADTLVGTSAADTIDGLAGDDRIYALAGNDTIDGGDGHDALFGGGGADLVRGGDGNDIVASTNQDQSIFGIDDTDDARDTLVGGAGNDTITAGSGDEVDGGSGVDQLRLSLRAAPAGLTVDIAAVIAGTSSIGGTTIIGVEAVTRVIGTAFDDRFIVTPQAVALTIFGGLGRDTADFSSFQDGITIDLTDLLSAPAVRLSAVEAVVGTNAADRLLGDDAANELIGGNGNDLLVGLIGEDTLIGGAGNDTLNGGLSLDRMIGGLGDDVYVAQNGALFAMDDDLDVIIEAPGEGFDTIFTANSFTLATGVSIELLSTENNAFDVGLNLAGNEFAQMIVGDYGRNRLTGGGGADTLIGLRGDDTYVVSTTDTVIRDYAGEGNDTAIISALNYQLAGDAEVETLSAGAGSAAINIAGNGFAQVINGNEGANILSTGGGAPDTMNGGLGDDIYRVFSTGDVINDTGGFDTVYASGTSYFLYSTAAVEYLSTSEQAGTQGFYMVGNGAAQVIVGNWGDNTLNGRGGDGVALPDTLIGLYGNDAYGVFSQGDVVREVAGQGNDVVFASASYQLRAGTEIEVLSAVNQSAGDAASAYTLRGNEFGQIVAGNNAANVLDGRGGNDALIGLGGADTFAFTTALDGTNNVDTVRDFASGSDRIGLASDVFAAVTDGGILAGEFVVGTAAADADDRLVYDQATGRLFFDADANGSGAAVLFAQFGVGTMLVASDVVVVAPVASLAAG